MAGLAPAIYAWTWLRRAVRHRVDAWTKSGHDRVWLDALGSIIPDDSSHIAGKLGERAPRWLNSLCRQIPSPAPARPSPPRPARNGCANSGFIAGTPRT